MKEQLLTFRMYAGIKFNRPIDKNKDYILPGGYEFVMGEKSIQFDFEHYEGNINKDNGCILDIMVKNPDYDTFADLKGITKEMLSSVTEIKEFFVYTGESGESDLTPVSLEYISFVLPYEDWAQININDEVIKAACVTNVL